MVDLIHFTNPWNESWSLIGPNFPTTENEFGSLNLWLHQFAKMTLGSQSVSFSKRPKTNLSCWLVSFPQRSKVNLDRRSTLPFKHPKPYKLLNLLKWISVIDLEIKHDLSRRFTELCKTLQRPLKLKFRPSRSKLTFLPCRFIPLNHSLLAMRQIRPEFAHEFGDFTLIFLYFPSIRYKQICNNEFYPNSYWLLAHTGPVLNQ